MALSFSELDTSKVLVPESHSSSLGGKPQMFESKGGSRKYKKRSNKKSTQKKGGSRKNKKTRSKK
jgi:hypothetical protein